MTDPVTRLNTALEGRYRIAREIGEGGMATVYLAEDLKHDRKVALKVLKPELAAVVGAERFLAEIKTTANLQHPHILPLFDSGEADGCVFYVMPFVRGESLRQRLERERQLPVDEAVSIAVRIAEALDYAHERGVIHRDIKPANVLLSERGEPLVADFGISLAVSAAGGGRLTETGLSLGTPHYMSPEQATADKILTARTDVYSLGSVLYEMLTGEPPHTASSTQGVIVKMLTEEPRPVRELRKAVPPHVADAAGKALEKLPADRFDTAAKFAEALADKAFRVDRSNEKNEAPAGPGAGWKAAAVAASALFLAATTIAFAGWSRRVEPVEVSSYIIALPGQLNISDFALSPDGSRIAYVAEGPEGAQLWVKERDQHRGEPVAGTREALSPTFSPDGQWLGFLANGEVRKVLLPGGAPVIVSDSAAMPGGGDYGTAWLDDGWIAFLHASWDLVRVPEDGGRVERLARLGDVPEYNYITHIAAYPGGVLYTRRNTGCDRTVWAMDVSSGEQRVVVSGGGGGLYVPGGHLLYGDCEGGVLSVPVDARLEASGPPIPVLSQVMQDPLPSMAVASQSGDLLYVEGPEPTFVQRQLTWVERDGTEEPISAGGTGEMAAPRLSRDGVYVAYRERLEEGDDVWIRNLETGRTRRITDTPVGELRPTWTHDSQWVGFVSDQRSPRSLFQARADGLGTPQLVLDIDEPVNDAEWSTSGNWIVYRTGRASGLDVYAQQLTGDRVTIPVAAEADISEHSPTLSPDERWVAYVSDETGRNEVYVRPFPAVDGARQQVSVAGGSMPHWGHSGTEIFFKSADSLMVVSIETDGASLSVGLPRALFSLDGYLIPGGLETFNVTYDVAPDDRRFIVVKEPSTPGAVDAVTPALVLVENLDEALRQGVAGR